MIEIEQSKKISNEQLEKDIWNAKKEVLAYKNLFVGYLALSELPELDEETRKLYIFRSKVNFQLAEDCQKFLDKLLALFKERKGIK